ncbi:CPBP family intramembrane glutamic endopeptidase [Pelagicoccus mobilis]|uniref:CPBP family intramembrane metalloprotease n=1 Tax=Pelagicoccus mobilis TaxID=415221 RepID=A0A934VS54_9BACT|nr:type II CAAX endopeptidase family protein [Pelagicoccus mobilis]MBK1878318.1 CPBP family intramembrane metalloprotease [Pelagicoccus mobilis]
MPQPRAPLDLAAAWQRLGLSPLVLVLTLFVLLAGLRIYGYFGSDLFQGPPIMIGFVLMWLLPFLFLSNYGREQIGFGRKIALKWILVALLSGAVLASLCHFLGLALYGKGEQNWFVSVAYTYQSDERIALLDRHVAYIIFTIPAIIASPIGEEIFFRGMIEQSKRDSWSPPQCALLSATLFALVHLVHHGVYRGYNGIEFMPTAGTIWFGLMLVSSLAFSYLKQKGGSIWIPITAHAGFNLAMNTYIFYSLFVTQPQTLPAS